MKLIAIDSSTTKTALANFVDGKYINVNLINMENEKEMETRIKKMALTIITYLDECLPDTIYIEETVVIRNANTQRMLTRLQGVVYGWCLTHNCSFHTIRPTTWRKLVGIRQGRKKREELKQEAIALINNQFSINVNDDEAEAILIGKAAFLL